MTRRPYAKPRMIEEDEYTYSEYNWRTGMWWAILDRYELEDCT